MKPATRRYWEQFIESLDELDDLMELWNLLRDRYEEVRKEKISKNKNRFSKGDKVDVVKNGEVKVSGTIVDIRRTKATIRSDKDRGRWNVPIDLMRPQKTEDEDNEIDLFGEIE